MKLKKRDAILIAAAKKSVQNSTTGQEETVQSSKAIYVLSALYWVNKQTGKSI